MIRSTTMLAGAMVLLAGCSGGSSDHREVLRVTESFFAAMEHKDVALASRVLVPEGVFVSMREGADGERAVRSFSNEEWMGRLESRERPVRESFTGRPFILIEGDVAMLWGDYTFDVDGERRHTGIDVFTFVKTKEGWKIAGGVYSVIPEH